MESESNDSLQNERYAKLGFKPQKEILFNKLLPYADKLDEESVRLLADIKGNLGRAMMLREYRPGFGIWISRLNKYIKVYGLKFSKEDHIALIKLLFEAIIIPELEPSRVYKIGNALLLLLKKSELISQNELELPWLPLHKLRERIITNNDTDLGMYRYFASLDQTISCLIESCRVYFPIGATEEILALWRPRMCPFSSTDMCEAIEALEYFLPIIIAPEHASHTYRLWLPELMDLWQTCHNAPPWESQLMWIVTRLSKENIGYIDWEPYIPAMFTRFLRSLDLPVAYKNIQNAKSNKIDISAMSLWIVSVLGNNSCAMKYLRNFMQTVESYFHHANQGRWVIKLKNLLKKLALNFVERLHKERYKEKSWHTPVPESHKLTENDITEFVEALKPVILHSIYGTSSEIMTTLQNLALLRPNIIIPLVLDKLYGTLDSLTEPHKLTAAMQCVVALARPLAEGGRNGYPQGPTHVIPLLMCTLPGIDPNDIRKCLVTFQFISTFLALIPLIDSSNASDYYDDLTEEEHIVCLATAQFEDFVLQFMDRVLLLIESCSLEFTRLEQFESNKRSKLENVTESALSSICSSLLTQTSHEIFKSALHKLDTFVSTHVLETKVSGQMAAVMLRCFARIRPEEVSRLFIPRLCDNVLTSLKDIENIKKEERLDNELLFNLLLLSEVVMCNGSALLPYEDILIQVMDRTLWLACKEAANIAHGTLKTILSSLTNIVPKDYRSCPQSYDQHVKDFLPVREWGKPGDIDNLKLQWYVPGKAELECVQRILWHYLPAELQRLEAYIATTDEQREGELEREELHRSLGVILSLLNCRAVLPVWKEAPVTLLETRVDMSTMELNIGCPGYINMPDGSNVRKTVTATLERLQEKILTSSEGDTTSLFHLITIWNTLLLNKANGDRGFEAHWKSYHNVKQLTQDRLRGRKRHLRYLLVDRTMLQHKLRLEACVFSLTATHASIMKALLRLATSSYSEVRTQAQAKLLSAIGYFPYSYTILLPEIKKLLELDSNTHHEQFKGVLYLLLGPKTLPLVARHDWNLVNHIWPTLVRTNLSEKPSVINLLDSLIDTVHKHFPTITIKLEIPDSCIEKAKVLWQNAPYPKQPQATPEEIEYGIVKLRNVEEHNRKMYNDTINQLMDAIDGGNLHWRYHLMALSFLRDLVHPDIKYNARVVRCFLYTLNHDSLDLRKIVLRSVLFVLRQHKKPHKKILVDPLTISGSDGNSKPGNRQDNSWLQYNSKTKPLTAEEWDKPRYLHKQYCGYYTWPKTIEMYAPSKEQPKLDRSLEELTDEEREVYEFFINKDNVAKLIGFLSLEEKKGKDKFSGFRFFMFKSLFRNHGDVHVPVFVPHLERLVVDKQEQSQRCAAEIIAGLIRGCKHWPFEKVEKLWSFLAPLIRTALAHMTVETVQDWGICFATAAERRDPNRNHWLFEILMEDPLRDEASFIECGRLYALQGALNQQEWRVVELFHRLRDYFKPFMTHPFQNVRERLSSVLTNITEADIIFPGGNKPISPRVEDIINEAEPQLNILYRSGLKDFNHVSNLTKSTNHCTGGHGNNNLKIECLIDDMKLTEDEKERTLRLMKTVFKWVVSVISRTQYSSVLPFYRMFGLACFLQSYELDEEVAKTCTHLLAILSQALHRVDEIGPALKHIKSIAGPSPSWSARVAAAYYLQSFVFHNMSLMLSKEEFVDEITNIVLILLRDEAVEVRTVAGQLLSGLLHCHFIPNSDSLLREFKLKANIRLRKRVKTSSTASDSSSSSSRSVVTDTEHLEAVRNKHSAILGLCAFINAYPYNVPPFVPDVFLILGDHLNDPQPIPTTIRKTLGDFTRTHHDNWETHKLQFTEEQLAVLSDMKVPPSYYA